MPEKLNLALPDIALHITLNIALLQIECFNAGTDQVW